MYGFSTSHMLILFFIVLIIFGPKNIPRVAQALGKGIREFKDATRGLTDDDDHRQPPPRQMTATAIHQPAEQQPLPVASQAAPAPSPAPQQAPASQPPPSTLA